MPCGAHAPFVILSMHAARDDHLKLVDEALLLLSQGTPHTHTQDDTRVPILGRGLVLSARTLAS